MRGWESLGGELASRPAVVSWGENEMQVFFIGDDGQLWDTYWDGAAWHERHAHGGDLVGSPAACSWGPDRIDLFARGRDGMLQHRWYEPSGWQAWESLGIAVDGDPAACSWGPDRIDLFARGATGALMHEWWDGARWSFEPGQEPPIDRLLLGQRLGYPRFVVQRVTGPSHPAGPVGAATLDPGVLPCRATGRISPPGASPFEITDVAATMAAAPAGASQVTLRQDGADRVVTIPRALGGLGLIEIGVIQEAWRRRPALRVGWFGSTLLLHFDDAKNRDGALRLLRRQS